MRDFVGDEMVATDDAAVGANADLDATVVKVGDDRFKGRCGLLDRRLEAVPGGCGHHSKGARGNRRRADVAQGCDRFGRGQGLP